MAHHYSRNARKLSRSRSNRIEGPQSKSIRTALAEERGSAPRWLQQISPRCRGAINSLLVEIVDGEIRYHGPQQGPPK